MRPKNIIHLLATGNSGASVLSDRPKGVLLALPSPDQVALFPVARGGLVMIGQKTDCISDVWPNRQCGQFSSGPTCGPILYKCSELLTYGQSLIWSILTKLWNSTLLPTMGNSMAKAFLRTMLIQTEISSLASLDQKQFLNMSITQVGQCLNKYRRSSKGPKEVKLCFMMCDLHNLEYSFYHYTTTQMGQEMMEGLRFLASLPLAGTGQREGGGFSCINKRIISHPCIYS